jgi:hypothetical protein
MIYSVILIKAKSGLRMMSLHFIGNHKAVEGILAEIECDIKYVNISILSCTTPVKQQALCFLYLRTGVEKMSSSRPQ